MSKISKKRRAKGFAQGFKEFITKGSIVDLAIGVVIGSAFGRIVSSLVNDIILPPIALLLGEVEFAELKWVIASNPIMNVDGTQATDPTTGELLYKLTTINYGNFIQAFIEFIIIAFVIYAVLVLVIRRKQFAEKLEKERLLEEESNKPKEIVVPDDIKLLTEIRDLLKKNE